MAKFRNLNVDFRDVMKLSMRDRLDMVQDYQGQGILANFTPAQLVDLFPRYYSERLPSIGKSLSKVSGGAISSPETSTSTERTTSGATGRATRRETSQTTSTRPSEPTSGTPRSDWHQKLLEKTGVQVRVTDPNGRFTSIEQRTNFIRAEARKVGIDPETAVRVANAEGNNPPSARKTGDIFGVNINSREKSYGAFQLNTMGGVGAEFQSATGLDPSNPNNEAATIRYALSRVRREGWSKWYGARNNGIANWDGIPKDKPTGKIDINYIRAGTGTVEENPSTIVEPPTGLNNNFMQEFNNLSPREKKNFVEAIQKLGEGNASTGVQRFNELYQTNPKAAENLTTTPSPVLNERGYASPVTGKMMHEGHGRTSEFGYGRGRLHAGVDIYSTDPETGKLRIGNEAPVNAPTNGTISGIVRNAGRAGNFLIMKDSNGVEHRFLHTASTPAINPATGEPWKKGDKVNQGQLLTHITGSGTDFGRKVAELNGDMQGAVRYFDQKGWGSTNKPHLHYETRVNGRPVDPASIFPEMSARTGNDERKLRLIYSNELDKLKQQLKSGQITQQEYDSQISRMDQGSSRQLPTNTTSPAGSSQAYGALAPQKKPEGTQTPQVTQPDAPSQPVSAPPAQPSQAKPEAGQRGAPTAIPTAATAPPSPPPPEKKKEEGSVDAQAFALGGETEASGPLTAYAIDKDKMRRDDTLVTDGRVKFTMNSEKESMKYNPDTGKVQIDQARGEARQKINAGELGPETRTETPAPTPETQQQVAPQQVVQPVQPTPQQNSFDNTTSLVDDIFKSASFKRAVASSRFMKDSDPLGGHYDQGAYNIV